ncbi:MAG: hypothetical protein ABJB16_05580 [Saprospiraceae bacterium]
MNYKFLLQFVNCLFAFTLDAQPTFWKDESKEQLAHVFDQMRTWHVLHTDYTITITHASFENYTTTIPYEKSTGYYRKVNDSYHSFLLGIHTIQNEKYKIILDTAGQTLMVANIDHSIWSAYTIEDYGYLLKACVATKVLNSGMDNRYRLEYGEGYPLDSYEMLVSGEGFLKEMVWYYRTDVPKDIDNEDSEKTKPRLSITFSSFKKYQHVIADDEFDFTKYFKVVGNKLIPVGKYKDFTLSDQRLTLD